MKPINDEDIKTIIAREITLFLEEHRPKIVRRALAKLRKIRKEAEKNGAKT